MVYRSWYVEENENLLREAVKTSSTFLEIMQRLGYSSKGNIQTIKFHADRLKIDRSHLLPDTHDLPKASFTEEEFRIAWQASKSAAECARKLGINPTSSTMRTLARRFSLSKEHFTDTSGCIREQKPLSEILVIGDFKYSSQLKQRLIRENLLKDECSNCFLTEWLGTKIVLELDHINGNNKDNRLENLRLLCPNCHSLTPTWRGRNKKIR